MEARLGFDAALAQASKNTTGPLAEELYRTLQEVQLGRSRNEAMRNLAAQPGRALRRAGAVRLRARHGAGRRVRGVGRRCAAHPGGGDAVKRRQLAEERAMKVPIKVLFPVLLCIFPALFVVILGPAIMRIAAIFAG
ncbi:MAG TPA: type II secretion system F family protein [Actinomycetota bacterium]|nr:type II secretion system F family protein [Actinomycetota bacterium]